MTIEKLLKEAFDAGYQRCNSETPMLMDRPTFEEWLQENQTKVKNVSANYCVSGSLHREIRDEMGADMEDSGMAQGEIESCLSHWCNKYAIQRKEWLSNDR